MEYKTTLPAYIRIEEVEEQKRYDKDLSVFQIVDEIVKAAFSQYFSLDADESEVFFEIDKISKDYYMINQQEYYIVAKTSRLKGFSALEFENIIGEDFEESDYNKIDKIAYINDKPITLVKRPIRFSFRGIDLKYRK